MVYLLLIAFGFALALSRIFRRVVFHPFSTLFHAVKDFIIYCKHSGWNNCPVGALDIYCGYFGSGKTLSLVHKVVGLYNQYNNKKVWCNRRKKFVTQKVVVLSNVDLAIPYVRWSRHPSRIPLSMMKTTPLPSRSWPWTNCRCR